MNNRIPRHPSIRAAALPRSSGSPPNGVRYARTFRCSHKASLIAGAEQRSRGANRNKAFPPWTTPDTMEQMIEPEPHQGRLALRPMEPRDMASVLAVEQSAFAAGWPATAFQNELTQNKMARYIVLEDGAEVTGFGGLWLMLDEAHVVTVAVRPERRRAGLGGLIVHGLLLVAQSHEMDVATLECRVSNLAARALYARYGFYEVGLRRKYYADNQEDAVIMTTESLASAAYQERLRSLEGELELLLPGAEMLLNPA